MPRKGTKTTLICNCGWQSLRMNEEELKDLGLPWYCEVCGNTIYSYITHEPHEKEKPNEISKIKLYENKIEIKTI